MTRSSARARDGSKGSFCGVGSSEDIISKRVVVGLVDGSGGGGDRKWSEMKPCLSIAETWCLVFVRWSVVDDAIGVIRIKDLTVFWSDGCDL